MNYKSNKSHGLLVLTLVILILSACGGEPQVQPTPAVNDVEVVPTATVEIASEATEEATTDEPESSDDGAEFQIVSAESEARFIAHEVLLGTPKTVVGITHKVEGGITADFADTSTASTSITIDLSDLETDDSRRTRTLRNNILKTSDPDNRYATFVSSEFFGLPESVEIGASYKVQITGELTIKQTTETVTFEGSITVVSETRLEGSFTLTILYTNFTTVFRLPPTVASVEEEIALEIDFVAER